MVSTSKTNSADYHDEKNSEHYIKWLTEQLLPTLDGPSVNILDNASYHNKQKDKSPTTSDRKDTIRQWLTNHSIPYNMTDIKKTLLDLVKQHRPEPLYLADEVIHEHGHTALQLPVAHCELNPIEMAWSVVKWYVARHNKTYNLTDAKQLTHEGFKEATPDMWRQSCRHVVNIENNYIEKDGTLEDAVEEMTIDLGESDDDDDDDSDWEDSLLDDDDRRLIDRSLEQSSLSGISWNSLARTFLMLCCHFHELTHR